MMLTVCNNSLMKPKNPNSWNKAPFPNHLFQVPSSDFRSVLHIVSKAALNKQNIELIRHVTIRSMYKKGRMMAEWINKIWIFCLLVRKQNGESLWGSRVAHVFFTTVDGSETG